MADFKIERKKLSIDIYGTVYQIAKPKFKQIIEMQEKLDTLNTSEKFQYIKGNLVTSGIPAEIVDDLDGDSMIELLEIINGTKKN